MQSASERRIGKTDARAGRLGYNVQKTEAIYQQYVVAHGLEREDLFRLLDERFALETVLYPGCFLHVTPSFWLQHVVYVDRNDLTRRFFEDTEGHWPPRGESATLPSVRLPPVPAGGLHAAPPTG